MAWTPYAGVTVNTNTEPSPEFLIAARQSHTVANRVTCNGVSLFPSDGSVSIDVTRAARRTVRMTIKDPSGELTVKSAASLLAPFGNEIKVERGLWLDGSTVELLPMGVFVIQTSEVEETAAGVTVTITGIDRSWYISRNPWAVPFQTLAGPSALEDTILNAVLNRWPSCPNNLDKTGRLINQLTFEAGSSANAWSDLYNLAWNAGYYLYFDATGVLRLRSKQVTNRTTNYLYQDGADAVLNRINRVWDTSTTFNGIIASSSHTDLLAPLILTIWDTDPTSPTYYLGKFGKAPKFVDMPAEMTIGGMNTAATLLLKEETGQSEGITWDMIVNPAHDGGDLIFVSRAGVVDGGQLFQIQTLEVPLMTGQMTGTARAV